MTVQVQTSDPNLEKKHRILSLLDDRKATCGSVSVKAVLAKDQGKWKNSLTVIQALHRDEPPAAPQTHQYPNCLLVKTRIKVEELAIIVEDLATKGVLKIKGVPDVESEGRFPQSPWDDFAASRDERFSQEWPVNAFIFEPNAKAGPPAEPYVAVDAPLFPSYWEMLKVWTGIDASRYNQYVATVIFLLPNFSSRIEELHLAAGTLSVKIGVRETKIDKVIGKLYREKWGGPVLQSDITFEQDKVVIPVGFVPDFWQVHILSKDKGEPLDFRKVHASWSSLPPGVVVEIGPAEIEEVLSRGENDQVEFKQEISKKLEEFLETVVAFANTRGGSIIVGVDDNGKIVGVYEQKFEERVQDLLRACEPSPDVSVERKELQEKTIYVVRVAEGKEKPYNLRNKGFLVRAGSTDRLASRIEMDQMYTKRQQPLLGARLY